MQQWNGIYKVIEETAELQAVLAKLAAFPRENYPDGTDLRQRVREEIADVIAAIDYFVDLNGLESNDDFILQRITEKRRQFYEWILPGVELDANSL